MVKRTNCNPSQTQLDRDWPHQIALVDFDCTGDIYQVHRAFRDQLGDSKIGRITAIGPPPAMQVETLRLFCFAAREDADAFQARFGGIRFDPAWRGKGTKRDRWFQS